MNKIAITTLPCVWDKNWNAWNDFDQVIARYDRDGDGTSISRYYRRYAHNHETQEITRDQFLEHLENYAFSVATREVF